MIRFNYVFFFVDMILVLRSVCLLCKIVFFLISFFIVGFWRRLFIKLIVNFLVRDLDLDVMIILWLEVILRVMGIVIMEVEFLGRVILKVLKYGRILLVIMNNLF